MKNQRNSRDFHPSSSTFQRSEKLDFPSDTDIRDLGTGKQSRYNENRGQDNEGTGTYATKEPFDRVC